MRISARNQIKGTLAEVNNGHASHVPSTRRADQTSVTAMSSRLHQAAPPFLIMPSACSRD